VKRFGIETQIGVSGTLEPEGIKKKGTAAGVFIQIPKWHAFQQQPR
jgi:hypothetical protein